MLLLASGAILPEGHNINCEHYDEKDCNTSNDCGITIERCQVEADKFPSCYVLWSADDVTGMCLSQHLSQQVATILFYIFVVYLFWFAAGTEKIKMKGCFTDMHECNQTACITSTQPRQGNIHFCCCKGSMCNTQYKWIAPTTEATTQGATDFNFISNIFYLLRFSMFTPIRVILYAAMFWLRFLNAGVARPPQPQKNATLATLFRVNELSVCCGVASQQPASLAAACVAISQRPASDFLAPSAHVLVAVFCMFLYWAGGLPFA